MSEKYVKLFEELDQEGAFDQEENQEDQPTSFEQKPEDDEEFVITNSVDMDNLTSGQKAALERREDILTPAQFAACYVRAKKAIENSEDTRGRGDNTLTRTAQNIQKQGEEDWTTAPAEKLGLYMGRKPSTVGRTVGSFRKMLEGEREISNTNRIFQLALEYFNKFEAMPYAEVLAGAELAITETPNDEEWEKYQAKKKESSTTSLNKKKASLAELRPKLRKSVLDLKNQGRSLEDAVRIAIQIEARDSGHSKETVAKEGLNVFKDEGFIKEVFRKYLKNL